MPITSQAFRDHSKCGLFGYIVAAAIAGAAFVTHEEALRWIAANGVIEIASLYGACFSAAFMAFFAVFCWLDGRTMAGAVNVFGPWLPLYFFCVLAFFIQAG